METTLLQILNRFLSWAEDNNNIRAVLLIGSRARTDHPADAWSDVDLIVAVRDLQPMTETTDWYEKLGTVWVSHLEDGAVSDSMERRVLFEGALEFDFLIVHEGDMPLLMQYSEMLRTVRRGMRVMVDKDRLMTRITLPIVSQIPYQPPTESNFLNVVNTFWHQCIWTAKKLQRGEVWMAKGSSDGSMKRLLLTMVEWHAHATVRGTTDTWFNGRFFEEWADPRVLAELKETYARYDAGDVKRSLLATMNLFRWLAKETAGQLTYAYPLLEDARVTQWVMEQVGISDGQESAPKWVGETSPAATSKPDNPVSLSAPKPSATAIDPAAPKKVETLPSDPPAAPETEAPESSG